MLQLREKCLKNTIISTNTATTSSTTQSTPSIPSIPTAPNNNNHPMLKLISLQRNLRANIINQNISQIKSSLQPYPIHASIKTSSTSSSSSTNNAPNQTEVRLLPPDQFYRSKKHNKRDIKGMEKEMKKKKAEKDEARR